MRWTKGSKWTCAAAGAVLLAAGAAYATVLITPSVAVAPIYSPGFLTFTTPILIDPNAVAAGGGGDQITWITEGRDNYSHFVSIGVWLSPTTLGNVPLLPTDPFFLMGASSAAPYGGGNVLSQGGWASPGTGYAFYEFTYRAVNDPLNPGWAAFTGGASQVADDAAAVHAVAETLRSFRDSVNAGGANPLPWLEIEIDPGTGMPGGGGTHPTTLEFYKFRAAQ